MYLDNCIRVPFRFILYMYDSQPLTKQSVKQTANLTFYRDKLLYYNNPNFIIFRG